MYFKNSYYLFALVFFQRKKVQLILPNTLSAIILCLKQFSVSGSLGIILTALAKYSYCPLWTGFNGLEANLDFIDWQPLQPYTIHAQ